MRIFSCAGNVVRASLAVVALVACTGCSDTPQELFEELDDPTPNKLDGVFRTVVEEAGMTTEVRLRFTSDKIIGIARCTPKNPKFPPIDAEGETAASIEGLDGAEGSFTVDPAWEMTKIATPISCIAGLRRGTHEFKIEEFKMTVRAPDVIEPIIYTKIGD
jgi:hypothetical protein